MTFVKSLQRSVLSDVQNKPFQPTQRIGFKSTKLAGEQMETLTEWIAINELLVYGLLFTYCATKSGALPLFAAIFAEAGALSIVAVFSASFLGGYLGDELRFWISRQYGEGFLRRFKKGEIWLETGKKLMDRYGSSYIFLYRYPKGMRTIGALPVGLSQMRWLRFSIFNAMSAGLWASILLGIGYSLGKSIHFLVEDNYGWFSVVLLIPFLIISWWLSSRLAREVRQQAGITQTWTT